MPRQSEGTNQKTFLAKESLHDLVAVLRGDGYTVVAPVLVDGAIMLRPVLSADDIARGVHDEQDGGHYWLVEQARHDAMANATVRRIREIAIGAEVEHA